MSNPQLRESLEQLHRELEQTHTVDDDSRERLQHLKSDIQAALDQTGHDTRHYHSLAEQLRASVNHFEDEHPRLTLSIGRVLDNLAAIGL